VNQSTEKTKTAGQPTTGMSRREKFGRAFITIVALLTVAAFVDGVHRMVLAGTDRIWVETWRTFGYVVFAGLFTLLALRPRNMPALWELTMAHKLGVTLFGLWLGNDVPEVAVAVKMDFLLVVLIGSAWVLCRGWLSWGVWNVSAPVGEHQH